MGGKADPTQSPFDIKAAKIKNLSLEEEQSKSRNYRTDDEGNKITTTGESINFYVKVKKPTVTMPQSYKWFSVDEIFDRLNKDGCLNKSFGEDALAAHNNSLMRGNINGSQIKSSS